MFGLSKLKNLHQVQRGEKAPRFAYLFGAIMPAMSSGDAATGLGYWRIKNSEVLTKGDVITTASGVSLFAAASTRPVGICDASLTATSTNETVAKLEMPYIPAHPDLQFQMEFNEAEVYTNQGRFYNLMGATGTQRVETGTVSSTIGQVCLLKLDPQEEGSAIRGLFRFAKGLETYTVAA